MLKKILFIGLLLLGVGILGYNFKTDAYTKEAVKNGAYGVISTNIK